jgi:hypothetical protein
MSKKPTMNFESISKDISKHDEKQHIDQIGPALTEVYLKHAKYIDDKGVTRFKKKFNKEEAEKLSDGVFDALAYHSHRRVFGIDEKSYDSLKSFKDQNGTPYIDTITQYHFKVDRKTLKKNLADDDENDIDHKSLEQLLGKNIEHHKGLLLQGVISKHGLDDPKHMSVVKGAIDQIVDKYKISKKIVNTNKIHDHDTALQTYIALSKQHYQD